MSVTGMMYKLIIGPLELLFDVVYAVANRYLSPGLSLIALSLAINFLVLPLYNRADAIQAEEREQGKRLKAGVDHIKATFKGDERFMMLQAYYRQNGYKPYYVLKGTLSLLLEIPFFIAAYRYLSGLQMLQGVGFGPIPDLGKPDGLLQIGGYALNLLPILMTVINIVSGAIYTKGQPLKDKIQLYGMAVLFLVLLFNSPSGLVFYWTLNNVFSLVKNVFVKLREPKKVLGWISACCGAGAIGLIGVRPPSGMRAKLILGLIGAALMAPAVMQQIRKKHPLRTDWEETKQDRVIFFGSCVLLAVLTGLLIPSAVIRSSPAEFIDMRQIQSPLRYLVSSGLLAAGAFLVWSGIFYGISPSGTRKSMSVMFLLAAGIGVTDYMFFGKNYGNMSPQMKYDVGLRISYTQYFVNFLVVAMAALLVIWIWRKKKELIQAVCFAGCIAVLIMSLFNIGSINKSTARIREQTAADGTYTCSIPLDKSGKNVMVIMLDRAISGYVPFILEEQPALKEQFEGFTYYPNACSFGGFTNVGVPPVFGGYEYTPENMNRKADRLLVDKHNEAMLVMPRLFSENGYETTVIDPAYSNYSWVPDLTPFEEYPDIHAFKLSGSFTQDYGFIVEKTDHSRNRNMFCYSLFRLSPLIFQDTLYNKGKYNEADFSAINREQDIHDISHSDGLNYSFLNEYGVLRNLPGITEIEDSGAGTFLLLTNNATHEPSLLREPEYVPDETVDNEEYDAAHVIRRDSAGRELHIETIDQMIHYHAMSAAMIQLGNWFDYMRLNGVYDNTRIIIVSDHGRNMGMFGLQFHKKPYDSYQDMLMYIPLLMVKDFDAEEWSTDTAFMTNADTPVLAAEGLIADPVNPFTGNPLTCEPKYAPELHILNCQHNIEVNNGTVFDPKGSIWITLRNGNALDLDNWEIVYDLPQNADKK